MLYERIVRKESRDTVKRTQTLLATIKMLSTRVEQSIVSVDTISMDLGNIGVYIEDNRYVIDLHTKLYVFDYDGKRYKLKNGFHVSYLEKITIPIGSIIRDVNCVGYHCNSRPYGDTFAARKVFDVDRKNDDIIDKLNVSRSLCVGPHLGTCLTSTELIKMVNTLHTPYAHTDSYDLKYMGFVDDRLIEVETWGEGPIDRNWLDDNEEN